MNVTKEEIKQFLKDSIEWLVDQDMGCSTLKLDDKLAICVGWLPGYGKEKRDDVIQSTNEPDFALNAGIKVYTSDDMRTDYEFINSPYNDNGEVLSSDTSLKPNDDLDALADYLIKEYSNLENLEIDDDGRVVEDNFDDSYEEIEDETTNDFEETKSNESLEEDIKEVPWVMQQGENGELEYIGFAKSKDEALKLVNPDIVTENTYISELDDKDIYLNLKPEISDEDIKKLDKYFDIEVKSVKESWEGESIIDDLIERAQSMYDEGGYGDIDECVAQAIDDGLIYSDDILELAKHYGTLPEDSDLIADFYDELSSDVYNGIEVHEESDEDEEDDFEDDEDEESFEDEE